MGTVRTFVLRLLGVHANPDAGQPLLVDVVQELVVVDDAALVLVCGLHEHLELLLRELGTEIGT